VNVRRLVRAGALSAVVPAALLCMLHASACGDASHVYQGRLYVEARDCLGTTSSVDVVEGDDPGSCAPTCLLQRRPDGGRVLYVSTMCGPYPFDFDVSGADPKCPAALAAFGRNDTCLSDGGSSAPPPPPAPPADAATD